MPDYLLSQVKGITSGVPIIFYKNRAVLDLQAIYLRFFSRLLSLYLQLFAQKNTNLHLNMTILWLMQIFNVLGWYKAKRN